ncbi:MAG: hypothetical protein HC877_10765 [Thioploca sp.]|nr:hypothetical protein [Thioploca sp.]
MKYIQAGRQVVVDIDLEKFFDRVNHDKLIGLLAKDLRDQRVLKLIRAYLETGLFEREIDSQSAGDTSSWAWVSLFRQYPAQ